MLDQQPPKAGAIDEDIAHDLCTTIKPQRRNIAAFAITPHVDDFAFGSRNATCLGKAPQIPRIQPGIEVKGIRHIGQHIGRSRRAALHPIVQRRQIVQRIGGQVLRNPLMLRAHPILVKRQQSDVATDIAKGMHVALARLAPADKLNRELERPLRCGEEGVLVEPERIVEQAYLRNRCFADTDCSNLFGFDQRDVKAAFKEMRHRGGNHPPGCPAASDHNPERLGVEWFGLCHLLLLNAKTGGAKHGTTGLCGPGIRTCS